METILEGAVDREHSVNDMLSGILAMGFFQRSTLTITSTDQSICGTVLITKGRGIKGARMDTSSETGYRALRLLFGMKQAYFSYETGGDDSLSEDTCALNIDIVELLKYLPSLPSEMPRQFLSDETIPPNSTFREELKKMAAIHAEEKARAQSSKVEEMSGGLGRMRDFECRTMVLRAPVFWACFVVVFALIWVLWGNDISAMFGSKHFAFGDKFFWSGSP